MNLLKSYLKIFHLVLEVKVKIKLEEGEIDKVLDYGAKWAVDNGYGWEEDLEFLEENGRIKDADSSKVSDKAKKEVFLS